MHLQRIDQLRQLASSAEESCAQALREAQQQHANAEQQLQVLAQYRNEYQAELGRQSLQPSLLHNRTLFLQRLNDSVRQQQDAVAKLGQNLEKLRDQWLAARSERHALDHLDARERERLQCLAHRVEQRETDDAALRMYRQR